MKLKEIFIKVNYKKKFRTEKSTLKTLQNYKINY